MHSEKRHDIIKPLVRHIAQTIAVNLYDGGENDMSGRIFQNVVLQIKEATDRVLGVIDSEGAVISCSDLGLIGARWSDYVDTINRAEGCLLFK